MTRILSSQLKSKYDFRSDVLDIIISGKSTIDASNVFQIKDLAEADRFIQSYGYNLENLIEKAEILGNFHEALNFIRKNFLQPDNPEGRRLEVPRKILELQDVRDLFLMASLTHPAQSQKDTQSESLRQWACSLLKVMHTIAHIDKDLRTPYFSDIQKQIFDRFYKLVHRDAEGHLFLGQNHRDPDRLDLVTFETKPKKSRDSIIVKLLHKPENVAEDIFDRVGIRFTTPTPLDALKVVKFLKDKMVVMPTNIKPSRSRNTLIPIDRFRPKLNELLTQVERNELDEKELLAQLELATREPARDAEPNPENPHSSEYYRAIQFTCRQLIKLDNPLYEDLKDLKNAIKSNPNYEDLLKFSDKIDFKSIQREIRFFYPFEVQIVDKQSAEENERGRSAHSQYKRAQILTAMNRVMGNFGDVIR